MPTTLFTGRNKDGATVEFTCRTDPETQGLPAYKTILADGVATRVKVLEKRVPIEAQAQMYAKWIREDCNGAELPVDQMMELLGFR